MPTVAFIGLGNMGGPMAKNLLKADWAVTAFDLSESALSDVVAAGAVAAATTMHVLAGDLAPGARGLASHADTVGLLTTLADRGVKPVRFEGISTFV